MKRWIRNLIEAWCAKFYMKREDLLMRLFERKRDTIIKAMYSYPSFINTGYLHFEQLFHTAASLGLRQKKGIIADVGGADGVTAIKLHNAFPNARVYVFEPLEENIAVLKQNILPYPSIQHYPFALGSEKSKSKITITSRITSSSLLKPDEAQLRQDYLGTQLKPQDSREIQIERMDDILPSDGEVLVMKMDVQGFELEVLKGAVKSLSRCALVMVEMQNHKLYANAPMYYDIDAFLREKGFELLHNIPSQREEYKQMEWDAIYINRFLFPD